MKLVKKPWAPHVLISSELTIRHQNLNGPTTDDEAERNVERFLAAHIIPVSQLADPQEWADGKDFNQPKTDGVVKNLLGSEVEIVEGEKAGTYVVKPGDIEVVDLSSVSRLPEGHRVKLMK
jgi:hypothetical protein